MSDRQDARGKSEPVPDDVDYIWLGEFLRDAPTWSTEDVSTARWLLAKQQQALDDAHPRDKKTREELCRVVEALEPALAKRD
jgi:hypothetical protein